MAADAEDRQIATESVRLVQLAFDRFKEKGEWPLVDELQHVLDTTGEDLDVEQVGESLDPRLGRVDRGYQGRVSLTLRGIRRCEDSADDLHDALDVMRLAYQRWLRDGPGATLSSADVEAELEMDSGRSHRVLEYIQWLPGIAGGSVMADGSWTRQISREIRRARRMRSIDELVELAPLPRRVQNPTPPAAPPQKQPQTDNAARRASSRSRSRQGRVWGGRWARIGDLGEGGQAHTFLVRDSRDGSEGWVLKRLKNVKRLGRFEREVRALRNLQSEHVPAVVDFSLEEPAYLVTPYVGIDLEQQQQGEAISVDLQLDRFRQVVIGAVDAHRAGLVHRDIKPNNVVVAPDGRTYLVDFGICGEVDAGAVLTTTAEGFGNRAFSAPECEPGSLAAATPAADVYSLGKLLYWMATSGTLVAREAFNPDLLPADRSAREVIVPILARTIREDAAQRWTSEELLDHVDWARKRLAEHRLLAKQGLSVAWDGFGPDHEVYGGGTRSATTPPHGNPPGQYEVAEAFSTGSQASVLSSIELYVTVRAGDGRATITLEADEGGRPSGESLIAWPSHVRQEHPGGGALIPLEPDERVVLTPDRRYWVCLSASSPGSDIAWVSAAINLVPRRVRIAERAAGDEWRPADSVSGPGHALRVLTAVGQPGTGRSRRPSR
jgi:hypothetical protein